MFTEESSGTNAISMSMEHKSAVHTYPGQHYCEFLRKSHIYCIPLLTGKDIIGYLSVIAVEQPISSEMILITDLLSYKLSNEFKKNLIEKEVCVDSDVKLSARQIEIFKLIARGMTDKAISLETGLSFVTVRYHKKNIYRKLAATSSVEAVVKALKLNLIMLDQITF